MSVRTRMATSFKVDADNTRTISCCTGGMKMQQHEHTPIETYEDSAAQIGDLVHPHKMARGGGARKAVQGGAHPAQTAPAAQAQVQAPPANPISRTSATTMSQITETRFSSLNIHPNSKKAMAEVLRCACMREMRA